MFFQNGIILLLIPQTSLPKPIHSLLSLAGVEIADNIAKFFRFLIGLDVFQQSQNIHLRFVQWGSNLFHILFAFYCPNGGKGTKIFSNSSHFAYTFYTLLG